MWHALTCWPKDWEIIDERPLKVTDEFSGREIARGQRFILKCKTCGWIKKRDCT